MSDVLDNVEKLSRRDHSKMLAVLGQFQGQVKEGLLIARKIPTADGEQIRNVLVAGVGGSAIGGDLVRALAGPRLKVPLIVNRGYGVPAWVGNSTLAIMSSYSGDTEETLSAFREVVDSGARVICLTSGGELEGLARERSAPLVSIPGGQPPRTALGYSMMAMLGILHSVGLAPGCLEEMEGSVEWISDLVERFGPEVPAPENPAKALALKTRGRLPVIFGSWERLDFVARRWAGQFAENGKHLAYFSSIPEMNHNEIVGWRHPRATLHGMLPIFLRDKQDGGRIQLRAETTRELFSEKVDSVLEFWSDGKSWAERLWSLILLGDFASVYLAVLNLEDPTPVEVIDMLKNKLKQF